MKLLKTIGIIALCVPWIIWQTLRGKIDISKWEVWK